MDTLPKGPVVYDPKKPSNIYFQENCTNTHYQSGRVYDAVGIQQPPDVAHLWSRRQATPADLQTHLHLENKRRALEKEMTERWAQMKAEAEASDAQLAAEMQRLEEAENAVLLRPLEDFRAQQQAAPPQAPIPHILTASGQKLDHLQSLYPGADHINIPGIPPRQTGAGMIQQISSKLRDAPWEVS